MPDETNDVTADPSSALGEAIASSPEALNEQAQGTETVTPQKTVSQEPEQEEPRVPYSRLKDVVDEKNYFRQLWEQERQSKLSQQQFQQPTQPQELGATPEEREFWKAVDNRAKAIAEQTLKQISPVIDAGRMELAQMKVQQFRDAHRDIKPNSPEEIMIAEKIQSGYLPEDAYKVVMWEKKVLDTENKVNIQAKQKIEAKKQANVESNSIPNGVNTHTKEKISLRDRIQREADKLDWS